MELVAWKKFGETLQAQFWTSIRLAIIRKLPGDSVLNCLIYNTQEKFTLTGILFYVAVNIWVKMCVVSAEVRPDYLTKTACRLLVWW